MQRCGPSGMFLLSACFGMFDFGMFKYFLRSACCIPRGSYHPHTTTPQQHVLCVVAPACLLHVYLPACFFFPRVSACLILACFLPHTHTCGQGLVLLVVATTGGAQPDTLIPLHHNDMFCAWSLRHVCCMFIFRHVSSFRAFRHV